MRLKQWSFIYSFENEFRSRHIDCKFNRKIRRIRPFFPPLFERSFRATNFRNDFYILNWLREIFHAFNTVICLFRTGFTVPETCWIKIFNWKRRGRRREKRFNVRPTFSEKIKIKISRSTWNDFHPFLENLEEKNVVSWAMRSRGWGLGGNSGCEWSETELASR